MADALEEAQSKIASLLQHPDDLVQKLPHLKAKFNVEKAALDAILKSSVQAQLDDTFVGLQQLAASHQLINEVKQSLATIDKISLDSKSVITNYPRIKVVSRTHHNFVSTKEVVLRFQDLSRDIEKLSTSLEAEINDPTHVNLLNIHFELYRLEEFRDSVMFQAKADGAAVLQIVSKYFKRLDLVSTNFTNHLWKLAQRMLDLIRDNQGNVVVRLCKIIEAEERADECALAAQNIRSSDGQLQEPTEFKIMKQSPRTIKNYRSQMMSSLLEKIQQDFVDKIGAKETSVGDALQACMFVFEDLDIVMNELGPRFPSKYKIFDWYSVQYHKQVYDLLNRLSNRNLEARDILQITGWVRDYYRIMSQRFQLTEELLGPQLLDDREELLIQEYIRLMKTKLSEWVDRLLQGEESEFLTRDKPPQTDSEGMYCSDAIVIFFQMINQQLEVAIEAARGGRLLLDVARECFLTMVDFQKRQIQILEAEEARFLKGQEIAQGFPEYVMVIANNHLKGTEYVETMQKKLDQHLDEKFRADASKHSNESFEGFMKVSKRGYLILMNMMFHDITPAFQQMFSPQWYEQPQAMSAILQTFDDYLQDYKKHLMDYLFSKLTTDALDRFLLAYVECFRFKQTKFKMPQFIAIVKSDVASAINFWSEYKTPKRVKQSFDIIEKVVGVIESSETMIFLSWYSLWKSYNDVPIAFVEDLLHKRDDLEKNTIKEAITNCRNKSKEANTEAVSSLFSKIYPSNKE